MGGPLLRISSFVCHLLDLFQSQSRPYGATFFRALGPRERCFMPIPEATAEAPKLQAEVTMNERPLKAGQMGHRLVQSYI